MSVTGTSFKPKTAECFVLECSSDNEKMQQQQQHQQQQNGNKTLPGDPQLKNKSCAKMRAKPILTVIILALGITCVFAYFSNRYFEKQQYCLTALCKRSERHLLESINASVNPCDNFYEFACGNWKRRHPIPSDTMSIDLFVGIQTRTSNQIAEFLKQADTSSEPQAVHAARTLFRSCQKAVNLNRTLGFQQIINTLEAVNLPVTPQFRDKSENFSWIQTAVLSKKEFGQNFFIEFSISSDPKNHTIRRLAISKPTSTSPLSTHRFFERHINSELQCDAYLYENETQFLTEKEDLVDDVFYEFVKNVTKYFYEEEEQLWTDETDDDFNELMVQFIRFNDEVNDLMDMYYDKSPLIPEYVTVEELQSLIDMISECNNINSIMNWTMYFMWMFEDIESVELDFEDRDQTILIVNREYLTAIFKLLANTPPYVMEFYMWWKTVYGIIPLTVSTLNEPYDEYYELVSGSAKRSRDLYCADIANEALGYAVAYFIVYDDAIKHNMAKISEMVDNIQLAFLEEIDNLDWMDEVTRARTLRKLKAMKKNIGYPEWMNRPEEYDLYYDNLTMYEDDFYNNVLLENKRQFYYMLENYHELDSEESDGWTSNPLDVNAFNNIEENTIMIPAGIFPFPFYQLGLESLNYGAIGTVIGHELTHGFDNTGKEYDDDGHLNAWWSNETRQEFEEKAECFINHYDRFNFTGLEDADNETRLDGSQTLDENIADNGGLRIAFYAYKNYVEKNGREKLLQGLKKYSNDQLFFLAFANTWCEHGSSKSLKISLTDEHSPNFVRVLATLINSKEFSETWKCPKGTPMNPETDKCQIW
ncbi:endothelin-converting enzyme homolog isoform X2 [Planococcus citri]|uniref:endothelin-converting enzyme homolog isoform X2 n=1 Tax=Planococcus citri TaxID=170843 RepID=UPI0031F990CF